MLILASASPARAALLRSAGIRFEVLVSETRELKGRNRSLAEAVLENARRKAASIARRRPTDWVLAADTMIEFEDRLYGKPADRKAALRLFLRMNGRSHVLATALVLRRGLRRVERVVRSRVKARAMDPGVLERVLRRGDPTRFAGGYAVRRRGDPLIERIDGSFSNVVGLPMETLVPLLRSLRIPL